MFLIFLRLLQENHFFLIYQFNGSVNTISIPGLGISAQGSGIVNINEFNNFTGSTMFSTQAVAGKFTTGTLAFTVDPILGQNAANNTITLVYTGGAALPTGTVNSDIFVIQIDSTI